MPKDTAGESVLDHDAECLLRQTLRDARSDSKTYGFDVLIADDVYVGFDPNAGYPADSLGELYVYIPDLTHHQRTDELGYPHTGSQDIFNQSKTLNVLANELRQILYTELDCDHTFARGDTEAHGGGVWYGTTVTTIASTRHSTRIPDDEI